jgi:methionyl-tRNA formyltransferase
MRLAFLGTPEFAVPSLEAIVQAGYEVLAVLTQPDRPRGLPVFQPERVRRPEAVEFLRALAVDAMVVVGYGQIIPQTVIDLAPLGIINVHASLLPKYRGAAPIQWAIANGETWTGVTTMRIDAGLDTGDILLQADTAIGPEETAVELSPRLAAMGADLLVQTLDKLADGTIVPQMQDASQATYAPLLKKQDGQIDWARTAHAIHNQVRGLQPWPGASTVFREQSLNVWKSLVAERAPGEGKAGFIIGLRPLTVECGEGALELMEVQLEGRKRMAGTDFANGQRVRQGEILE